MYILHMSGFDITNAANGFASGDYYKKLESIPKDFEAYLLEKAKEHFPHIPIYTMTGYCNEKSAHYIMFCEDTKKRINVFMSTEEIGWVKMPQEEE